jgi:hypothetical protein
MNSGIAFPDDGGGLKFGRDGRFDAFTAHAGPCGGLAPGRARSAVIDVGAGGSRRQVGRLQAPPPRRQEYGMLSYAGAANPPWQQDRTSRSTSGVHGLGTKLMSSEPAGQTIKDRPR